MRIFRAAATLLSAFTLTASLPATAQAAPSDLGDTVTLPVSQALAGLPVHDEVRAGYSRDLFRHWIDADRDGCSTRAKVLLQEAVTAPGIGARSWFVSMVMASADRRTAFVQRPFDERGRFRVHQIAGRARSLVWRGLG